MEEVFDHLETPQTFVAAFPPDRDGLFDLVRSRTTDRMLEFIAEADYEMCVPEYFSALSRIRSGIGLDEPIRGFPDEVLSLFRWSNFENQDQFQDSYEFHLARAFVCSTLLRVPLWIDPQSIFDADALGPLIESCLILGEPFLSRLASLITWGLLNMDGGDSTFWSFGLWVAVAGSSRTEPDVARQVGEWVMEMNNEIVSSYTADTGAFAQTFLEMNWLLIRPDRWRKLAASLKPSLTRGSHLELFAHLVATPP